MSAKNWSAAQRRDKAQKAHHLHTTGSSLAAVSRAVECDYRTARNLISEEAERLDNPYELMRKRAVEHHMLIQKTLWEEFRKVPDVVNKVYIDPDHPKEPGKRVQVTVSSHQHIKIGIINSLMKSQGELDLITGAKAEPREHDPAKVEVTVNVSADAASAESGSPYERLLGELDAYRVGLDDADRRHNPRLAVDTDNPNV